LQHIAPADVSVVFVQKKLLALGHPVAWALDVPPQQPAFMATQWLILNGVIGQGERAQRLEIALTEPLDADSYAILMTCLVAYGIPQSTAQIAQTDSWESVCARIITLGLVDAD
jgi:hypothetical protein